MQIAKVFTAHFNSQLCDRVNNRAYIVVYNNKIGKIESRVWWCVIYTDGMKVKRSLPYKIFISESLAHGGDDNKQHPAVM